MALSQRAATRMVAAMLIEADRVHGQCARMCRAEAWLVDADKRTEATHMTEYGKQRERRRKQRSLLFLVYTVGFAVVLSVKVGVAAIFGVAGFLIVVYAALTLVVWRGRWVEKRRRATGAPPSWPAQLSEACAVELGVTTGGRHGGGRSVGEFLGRIVYLGDGFRWEPGRSCGKRVRSFTWDRSWSSEVVSLWGPGSQGCLTLTRSDGEAVDVWIRNPNDLRRTLGLACTYGLGA